ncbi:hypothetical protein PIB30_048399 [Stylosanthes scabra]|uniref:Transmembrane protein n=1 Tax=Stylosanthes scabra TaxID=79078 RepID=A0ABU6ZFR7_9FABA|nr:hypothetical protein [Stylosanthes scabra]
MAKTKTKIITSLEYPKPKFESSIYLCCFGNSSRSSSTGSTNNTGSGQQRNLKQKSWFPWQRFGKTVPLLEGLEFDEKNKKKKLPKLKASYNKVQYSSSKWRSKSNLHNKTQQANHPTPTPEQKPPLIPHIVPNQPLSYSKRSQPRTSRENKALESDTCQQGRSSPTIAAATATSHWDPVPASKRHVHRTGPQTTPKQHGKHQNANRYYSPVVGTSVVMVTLVIMLLWGRLCAIVCTSTWLYFVHRFRLVHENGVVMVENTIDSSKELDLDSNLYKKKVVLEGLLERGHSGVL